MKQEPKVQQEVYPDHDMLDGWDDDFDLKDNPKPKAEAPQQQAAFDDYDDFEAPPKVQEPIKPARPAQSKAKLDDYLDDFN